ncbi:XRE family transcriptional regulator [Gilvimarinus sp. F26214L]|uniref:XRE family transcriptional regulator n=1 Tax=Gilvimarinus sp. DZF01 TaxID=3461371 RepID=UPI0040465BD0
MSKLETAFSKAMKEQGAGQSTEPAPSERRDLSRPPVNVGAGRPASKRGGLSNVVSSRGMIKAMTERFSLSDSELATKGLIYPRMEDTRLLNIYRNLRTKLLAAANGRNFTTLVTSVVPGTDTGLIAANLAASFAFDEGKTAMLLEGDVHSPSLARLFDLDPETDGLMDYLEAEERSIAEVIHPTGIPRLRFIPSGQLRENSAEYFTSEKMHGTIEEILTRYPDRYPIVDAPSVQDSADARILLDLCDLVVLVVPYGECTEQEIRTAAETIGSEKLVGVVLDQF